MNVPAVAAGGDAPGANSYAWRVLSVTCLGGALVGINSSTLDVGLPTVTRQFDANPMQANWFLLSYMLVNTVLILVFGRVADLVGRRWLYVLGLATLTAASLGCGLAPNANTLIGLRALQAVGAAAIITNGNAQLADAFPRRLLGTALGFNLTVISASMIVGPAVGGILISELGWRAVFWVNVPVGAAGLVWAAVTLRPGPVAAPDGRFDAPGALLCALWLSGLVLALSEGGALGWSSPVVVVGASVTLLTLPIFLIVESRRRDPMIDLRLFRDRPRAMAYLSTFLVATSRFALVLLASLFFQAAQGLGPLAAGVRVVPLAAGIMIASPVAGRLTTRFSARVLSTGGCLVTTAALLSLAAMLKPTMSYFAFGIPLLLVGLGTGMFMTPNTSTIMGSISAGQRGVANGVRSMLQNTGFLLSTALSLVIITGQLSAPEKKAVYAGALADFPGSDLPDLINGYRAAVLLLAALSAVAAAASGLRGRTPSGVTQPSPALNLSMRDQIFRQCLRLSNPRPGACSAACSSRHHTSALVGRAT